MPSPWIHPPPPKKKNLAATPLPTPVPLVSKRHIHNGQIQWRCILQFERVLFTVPHINGYIPTVYFGLIKHFDTRTQHINFINAQILQFHLNHLNLGTALFNSISRHQDPTGWRHGDIIGIPSQVQIMRKPRKNGTSPAPPLCPPHPQRFLTWPWLFRIPFPQAAGNNVATRITELLSELSLDATPRHGSTASLIHRPRDSASGAPGPITIIPSMAIPSLFHHEALSSSARRRQLDIFFNRWCIVSSSLSQTSAPRIIAVKEASIGVRSPRPVGELLRAATEPPPSLPEWWRAVMTLSHDERCWAAGLVDDSAYPGRVSHPPAQSDRRATLSTTLGWLDGSRPSSVLCLDCTLYTLHRRSRFDTGYISTSHGTPFESDWRLMKNRGSGVRGLPDYGIRFGNGG